jgi:hypothetical protein
VFWPVPAVAAGGLTITVVTVLTIVVTVVTVVSSGSELAGVVVVGDVSEADAGVVVTDPESGVLGVEAGVVVVTPVMGGRTTVVVGATVLTVVGTTVLMVFSSVCAGSLGAASTVPGALSVVGELALAAGVVLSAVVVVAAGAGESVTVLAVVIAVE